MNRELVEKFNLGKKDNSFRRINEYHSIDIFIGYDVQGNPTIAIRGKRNKHKIISAKYIEVRIGNENDNLALLSFSLLDMSMFNIFIQFCDDIIYSTLNDKIETVLDKVIDRWESWKRMFRNINREILSEQSIKGLIGELLFLDKYMIERYGSNIAIKSWTGPQLAYKDFEMEDLWYEIKTVTSNALTVKISSIQQLDSELEGYLVVINLDKNNNMKNIVSLNNLIEQIKEKIINIDDRLLFLSKLLEIGYEYNDQYDNYSYILKDINFYMVNDDFPKIKKSDLKKGIVNANYEISLQYIDKFIKEVDVYGFEGI